MFSGELWQPHHKDELGIQGSTTSPSEHAAVTQNHLGVVLWSPAPSHFQDTFRGAFWNAYQDAFWDGACQGVATLPIEKIVTKKR